MGTPGDANAYTDSVTGGLGALGSTIGSFLGALGNALTTAGSTIADSAEDITQNLLGGDAPDFNTPTGGGTSEEMGGNGGVTQSTASWSPFTAVVIDPPEPAPVGSIIDGGPSLTGETASGTASPAGKEQGADGLFDMPGADTPSPDYLNEVPLPEGSDGTFIDMANLMRRTAVDWVGLVWEGRPEEEQEEDGVTESLFLDIVQGVLDVGGLAPGIGEPLDIASGIISALRGDKVGAALSLASAVPFEGWLASGAKIFRRGEKIAEAVVDGARTVQRGEKIAEAAVDGATTASKYADVAKDAMHAADAAKGRALKLPDVGDLPSGTLGTTDWAGNIRIQRGLPWSEQREVLLHESVHRFFTAKDGPLVAARQWLTRQGYGKSHLLRGLEEMIAEGYAKWRVSGSLWNAVGQGYAFAFSGAYQLNKARFYSEGGVLVGGAVSVAWWIHDWLFDE